LKAIFIAPPPSFILVGEEMFVIARGGVESTTGEGGDNPIQSPGALVWKPICFLARASLRSLHRFPTHSPIIQNMSLIVQH